MEEPEFRKKLLECLYDIYKALEGIEDELSGMRTDTKEYLKNEKA